jgi:hypothetical protein
MLIKLIIYEESIYLTIKIYGLTAKNEVVELALLAPESGPTRPY